MPCRRRHSGSIDKTGEQALKPQCRFGHHRVREDSNRLPRADYDAHSCLCVAPASLNGFLTWRSGNGADSSGIAPIPVQLSLFSSRLLANLRENAFQILQRGLWTSRAGCVHFAEGVWERTGGRSGEADCNAGSAALSLIPSPSTIV